MKKITFLFLLLLLTTSLGYSQTLDVTSKSFYSYNSTQTISVIKPTIKNLLALMDMSQSTFAATMARYDYHKERDKSGKYLSFTNATIDNVADSHACNSIAKSIVRDEVRYIVFFDNVYPANAISDLISAMKPYLSNWDDMGNVYSFKHFGRNYNLYITINRELSAYDIQLIKR